MSRLIRLAGVLALVAVCLPAANAAALSFSVENTDNAGDGSLRAAILETNEHNGLDSIPINASGTIELDEKLPAIIDDVTITGPGAGALTVQAATATSFRVFEFLNTDATVSDLTVSGGEEYAGAGILSSGGSLTLIRVTVSGNDAFLEASGTALATGGGILSTGALTLRESLVAGNSAEARGADESVAAGGGIEASGPVTIERSTITGNSVRSFAEEQTSSVAEGGGLLLTGGPLTIDESTISGNSVQASEGQSSAVARGGGLVADNGIALSGVTFAGNSAAVEENLGFSFAGGANIQAGSVVVRNTIFADPRGGVESCGWGYAPGLANFTSGGFNLDEDESCGLEQSSDLVGVAAGLEPELKDNGGPTPTHALLPGSPAIDRGNSFGTGVDQRGLPRPSDFPEVGNAEGGDGSDIGAFELQLPPASPGPGGGTPVVVTQRPTDSSPPQTRILSGPPRTTFKTKAKFRFASSEAQSHFQCKLDKKKWKACSNPFRATVKPARHLFKVRAIDRFGNVDPTPARFGWRVKRIVG